MTDLTYSVRNVEVINKNTRIYKMDFDSYSIIFKPIASEQWPIRKDIHNRNCCYAYREVMSFEASELLDINWIPRTEICKISGEEGSSQLFITNAGPSIEQLIPLQRYRIAVLDYIIGNLDRHNNNCLYTDEPVLIDNSLTFPAASKMSDDGLAKFRCLPVHKIMLREKNIDDLDELIDPCEKEKILKKIKEFNSKDLTYFNKLSNEEIFGFNIRLERITESIEKDNFHGLIKAVYQKTIDLKYETF